MTGTPRLIIVDDNSEVLNDFRKVLCPASAASDLSSMEAELFGAPSSTVTARTSYDVTFATSGRQALEAVMHALRLRRPYAGAIVDMRMPGWNGVETIQHLREKQRDLPVAICSAFMDYSWQEVIAELNDPGIRLLHKPWSTLEALETVSELLSRARRTARES